MKSLILVLLINAISWSTTEAEGEVCSVTQTCPQGSYCTFIDSETSSTGGTGSCEVCPDSPDFCDYDFLPELGVDSCWNECPYKPCSSTKPCSENFFCTYENGDAVGGVCEGCFYPRPGDCSTVANLTFALGVQDCTSQCEFVGCDVDSDNSCPEGYVCTLLEDGAGICDVAPEPDCKSSDGPNVCGDRFYCGLFEGVSSEGGGGDGYCNECPDHIAECFASDMGLSDDGKNLCAEVCQTSCYNGYEEKNVTMDSINYWSGAVVGSPSMELTGALVACSLTGCDPTATAASVNGGDNSESTICLMETNDQSYLWEYVLACQNKGGGAGAILYGDFAEQYQGSLYGVETSIPSVTMTLEDGQALIDATREGGSALPVASMEVSSMGELCFQQCSEDFPCHGEEYCNFEYEGSLGYCEPCRSEEDDANCFARGLTPQGAAECASICSPFMGSPVATMSVEESAVASVNGALAGYGGCVVLALVMMLL